MSAASWSPSSAAIMASCTSSKGLVLGITGALCGSPRAAEWLEQTLVAVLSAQRQAPPYVLSARLVERGATRSRTLTDAQRDQLFPISSGSRAAAQLRIRARHDAIHSS